MCYFCTIKYVNKIIQIYDYIGKALDAELHSDLEGLLLGEGSLQEALWGINLYPEAEDEDFLEFDSLINIRPRQGNRSRYVENEEIREKIRIIVNKYMVG